MIVLMAGKMIDKGLLKFLVLSLNDSDLRHVQIGNGEVTAL